MSDKSKYGRREALLLLAGGLLPTTALAADEGLRKFAPTEPRVTTPAPTIPTPNRALFGTPLTPAAPISPESVDKNKSYFVFFQRSIDIFSIKTLRANLCNLVEGGATDITLVINSPGGTVMPALQMYSLIRSLPAKITTHGQGFVQSAATILLLAGEERSADKETRFLFHPSQMPVFGTFNSPQFEDRMRTLQDADDILGQIYQDRTKIPADDIKRIREQTVVYDTAKAMEYGIIKRVDYLKIPGDKKAKLIFMD